MVTTGLPQPNPHKEDVNLMVTFYTYIVNFILALGLSFSKLQIHHTLRKCHGPHIMAEQI